MGGDPWTEGGWHKPPIFENGMIYSITQKQYKDAHLEHTGGEWHKGYLDCKNHMGCSTRFLLNKNESHWSCCLNSSFFGKCKNHFI